MNKPGTEQKTIIFKFYFLRPQTRHGDPEDNLPDDGCHMLNKPGTKYIQGYGERYVKVIELNSMSTLCQDSII